MPAGSMFLAAQGAPRLAFRRRRRVKKVAKLAPKTTKAVRRIAGRVMNSLQEHKYLDFKFLANTYSWNGSTFSLSDMNQSAGNSTDTTRIGDQITPTSFYVDLDAIWSSASDINCVRFILFRWHSFDAATHGIVPTPSMILQFTSSDGASVHSPLIHDSRPGYTCLYDKTIYLDGAQAKHKPIKFKLRLAKTKPIQYYAGSTEGRNKIWGMFITDQDPGTPANLPQVRGYTRLNYVDS